MQHSVCVDLRSLTRMLDHRLQHPVALVPSPPERQRLVLIEELLQVGGRGGMGGAEVEGAVARVALCQRQSVGLSNDNSRHACIALTV